MGSLSVTAPSWHLQSLHAQPFWLPPLVSALPVGKYKIAPFRIQPALFKQMFKNPPQWHSFVISPTLHPTSSLCPTPVPSSRAGKDLSFCVSQSTFQKGLAQVKDWNRGLETSQIVALHKCEFSWQLTNVIDVFLEYRPRHQSTLSFHQSVFKGSG